MSKVRPSHATLLDLLKERIADPDLISLIKQMLDAGYVENWTWKPTFSGTPQGGVISPLLANVYLHELDRFMEKMKAGFDLGKGRRHHRVPGQARHFRVLFQDCSKGPKDWSHDGRMGW